MSVELDEITVHIISPLPGAPFNVEDCEIVDIGWSDKNINVECKEINNRISYMESKLNRLESERDALLESLTPSAGTKAAYMGEFVFRMGDGMANVPWVTIKEIMAAIRNRASLAQPSGKPEKED